MRPSGVIAEVAPGPSSFASRARGIGSRRRRAGRPDPGAGRRARRATAGWRCWPCATSAATCPLARSADRYYTSYIENGLRIAESLGDRASEADLLARLAIIAANRLRLDAALDYGLRAVAAGRASADERALATGLDGLKIACLNVGDAHGLAAVLDELKPLLRRLGDLVRLQWAEFESAFLFVAAADWDQAAAAMQNATEINRRGGYPTAAWFVAHSGWLARLRGRDDEALRLGREALA